MLIVFMQKNKILCYQKVFDIELMWKFFFPRPVTTTHIPFVIMFHVP